MTGIFKIFDGWLLLLLFILGFWWLIAGNTGTQASEIEELSQSTDPARWLEALTSSDRTIRDYARSNMIDVLPMDALEIIAVEIFETDDPDTTPAGLWLLTHVDIPGRSDIAAEYLDDENSENRKLALSVLIDSPNTETRERIIELTDDTDRAVQAEAINALAVLKNRDDLPVFISFLGYTNATVRNASHDAILEMAESVTETVPSLFGVAYGTDPSAAREALELIGEIGDQSALNGLFDFLEVGPVALLSDASNAIAAIGGDDVSDRALDLFLNGENRQRTQAAKVLGAMGNTSAAIFLWSVVIDRTEDFWLRYNSMNALATCGDESMVEDVLMFLTETDHDPRLVRIGIETLGGLGGDRVLELYDHIIAGDLDLGLNRQGGNPALLSVITGLGKMNNDESRERLRELARISDRENFELLIDIVKAFGEAGTSDDIDLLSELEEGKPVLSGFVDIAVESIRERYPG